MNVQPVALGQYRLALRQQTFHFGIWRHPFRVGSTLSASIRFVMLGSIGFLVGAAIEFRWLHGTPFLSDKGVYLIFIGGVYIPLATNVQWSRLREQVSGSFLQKISKS